MRTPPTLHVPHGALVRGEIGRLITLNDRVEHDDLRYYDSANFRGGDIGKSISLFADITLLGFCAGALGFALQLMASYF